MKQFLFLLAFMALLSTAWAQGSINGVYVMENASVIARADTLNNQDTLDIYLGTDFTSTWTVDALIAVDSISGAIAGTMRIEEANTSSTRLANTSSTLIWVPVTATSTAMDGAGRSLYRVTHTVLSRRCRMRFFSLSGTHKQEINYRICMKKAP